MTGVYILLDGRSSNPTMADLKKILSFDIMTKLNNYNRDNISQKMILQLKKLTDNSDLVTANIMKVRWITLLYGENKMATGSIKGFFWQISIYGIVYIYYYFLHHYCTFF